MQVIEKSITISLTPETMQQFIIKPWGGPVSKIDKIKFKKIQKT